VTNDPYAPPKAVVANPIAGVESFSRPHEVALASRLLWCSLVLGVVNFVVDSGPAVVAGSLPPVAIAVSLSTFGLLAWLTHGIGRGGNWARVTFLVMFVLGVPVFLWALPTLLERSMLATATSLAISVLQIVALYLVFTRVGARWFRRSRISSENVA
jgi:hypothetical protein